jgi:hypothetical protein
MPSIRTLPFDGGRWPATIARSVDFPDPAGPEIPATSPAATRKETSSSARAGLADRDANVFET